MIVNQFMSNLLFLILASVVVVQTLNGAYPLPDASSSSNAVHNLNDWLSNPRDSRPPLTNQPFASVPLTREDAEEATRILWQDHTGWIRLTRSQEMADKQITLTGFTMKFEMLAFTNAPAPNGPSLFISLHGGGGATTAVNDSQWRNQIKLASGYRPKEGIYVAPRAPTDTWDLWHQAHIDLLLSRLIENLIVISNVNPNRVFVLGYSAGGDGIYQIVPRTADRWAAAAMMAGHPNEASPLGLRNVPFAIQVGANDHAYHRNEMAVQWGGKLDDLQRADPEGYIHFTKLHAGKGHWMDLEDRNAVPWMEKFARNTLPKRVVWFQDDVTHTTFYWLAVPENQPKAGQEVEATREGQLVNIQGKGVRQVTVFLNDRMLDLDQPVEIRHAGKAVFAGRLTRSIAALSQTLESRGDTNLMFSARVTVSIP